MCSFFFFFFARPTRTEPPSREGGRWETKHFMGMAQVILKINRHKLNLGVKVELVGYRIHKKLICPEHFTDNIERKYFRSALKRRLSNKTMIRFKRYNSFGGAAVSLKSKQFSRKAPRPTGSQSMLTNFFST